VQSVVAPTVVPYRPALHKVHAAATAVLYRPAVHLFNVALVEPAGHAKPAEQFPVQVLADSPDVLPYTPAGHGPEQTAEVRATLLPYCPAGQSVQEAAPAGLYFPRGHAKAVLLVDPAGQ
jgi:hypothetical protein